MDPLLVAAIVLGILALLLGVVALWMHLLLRFERARADRAERTLAMERDALDKHAFTISHDARAPLRHVNGFAELIEARYAGQLEPKGREMLGRIREAGRKADALLEQVVRELRAARVAHDVEPEPVDRLHDAHEA